MDFVSLKTLYRYKLCHSTCLAKIFLNEMKILEKLLRQSKIWIASKTLTFAT